MKKKGFAKRRMKRGVKVIFIFTFLFFFIYLNMGKELFQFMENIIFYQDDSQDIIKDSKNDLGDDFVTRLKSLSSQETRIHIILEHMEEYPDELLDMLSRNLELLDFVLDFPQKKGQVFSDTIGTVKKGTYPLLLQWDPRWGYANYGENYLAISGCAPTALAMVIAGLTGNDTITPYTVSQYAMDKGYYRDGIGTSWSLMTEGSKHFKVLGTELPLSKNAIYDSLSEGYPIICSMGPGDFTREGHFIVLTGLKNGKIKVNDPNSKERSNQLWDYETLEYQIKNLWSFRAI